MLAIALMILGALGTAYNFMSAPKTLEEAKEIVNSGDFSGDEIIDRDNFQITESYEESEEINAN